MRKEIRQGFVIYVIVMAVMFAIYLALQSSAWGRHVWAILSTQPSNWHI
jgi:ABC-type xylose transport system permease subunit